MCVYVNVWDKLNHFIPLVTVLPRVIEPPHCKHVLLMRLWLSSQILESANCFHVLLMWLWSQILESPHCLCELERASSVVVLTEAPQMIEPPNCLHIRRSTFFSCGCSSTRRTEPLFGRASYAHVCTQFVDVLSSSSMWGLYRLYSQKTLPQLVWWHASTGADSVLTVIGADVKL